MIITTKIALKWITISVTWVRHSNLQCFSLPKRVYWYQKTLPGNLKTGGDPIISITTLSTLYQMIFLPCPCHERIKVQKLLITTILNSVCHWFLFSCYWFCRAKGKLILDKKLWGSNIIKIMEVRANLEAFKQVGIWLLDLIKGHQINSSQTIPAKFKVS